MPAKKAAKKATAKKATKKVAAKKSPTTKSASAKKVAVKKVAAKKAAEPRKAKALPSTGDIARQAYLNYLHRVQNGLPGDSHGDWIAAEEQLTSR